MSDQPAVSLQSLVDENKNVIIPARVIFQVHSILGKITKLPKGFDVDGWGAMRDGLLRSCSAIEQPEAPTE